MDREFSFSDKYESRIEDIIKKMSLDEKIELIGGDKSAGATKANDRIGMPQMRMSDGPSGVHWWTDASPTYPDLIALTATYNKELSRKMGESIGRDARVRGINILLGPGVNIYRSPLCGRNFEYFGEDPYLASKMVLYYILGVQSQGVSATVKHFAVNFQEYNRHYVSSDVDERTLNEIYFPAFKTAVVDGNCGAVMTSYNLLNGVHCSENRELIIETLKKKWGFKGVVMSDWTSVYTTVDAVNNGLDLEMPYAIYFTKDKIFSAMAKKEIDEKVINDKVRRMLRLAMNFGWFDRPDDFKSHSQKEIEESDKVSENVALQIARESIVLLKNSEKLLPLDKERIKRIAVVGPTAHPAVMSGGGSAYNKPPYEISILDGIKEMVGQDTEILHSSGIDFAHIRSKFENSIFYKEDGTVGVKAEYYEDGKGEPIIVKDEEHLFFILPEEIKSGKLPENISSAVWTGFIIPDASSDYSFFIKGVNSMYKIYWDDNLLVDSSKYPDAQFRDVEIRLEQGKKYKFRIEWKKDVRGAGCFFMGYESKMVMEEMIKNSVEIANKSDVAVVCCGFNSDLEGEGFDRSFNMPLKQDEFIQRISEANPNTVVVLTAGGGVDMSSWLDKVKSVVNVWYPGYVGGRAVAEVLFGKVAPCGKLPISIERRLDDNATYDSYWDDDNDLHVKFKEGIFIGYRHFDKNNMEPLFPFGYGLSYTEFETFDFNVSSDNMKYNEKIKIGFKVKNIGKYDGAEVFQLYISDVDSKLPRPVKELKDFQKVFLKKEEMKKVEFEINLEQLKYYDPTVHNWVADEGEFIALIGTSSRDIIFEHRFILKRD